MDETGQNRDRAGHAEREEPTGSAHPAASTHDHPTPPPARGRRPALLGASLLLLTTTLLLGGHVLGRGAFTYMDNPVHIAEIHELSQGHTWSELAFCGFPLGHLHSPLWYGLAALAVQAGMPLVGLYKLLLVAGACAPALALLGIAYRRGRIGAGLAAGWLWLILPTNAVGYASAFGGMWTFHLGCAFLILLVDAWARSRPRMVTGGIMLALIGLTHHFVLVVAAIVSSALIGRDLLRKKPREALQFATCAGAAALVSMPYWGPTLAYLNPGAIPQQTLSLSRILLRLFAPSDLLALLLAPRASAALRPMLHYSDCLPPLLLLGLSIHAWRAAPESSRTFVSFALAMSAFTFLLVAASSHAPVPILGPLPWRFIAFVQLGQAMAVAAAPLPVHDPPKKWMPPVSALLLLSTAVWFSLPLRAQDGAGSRRDLADLETLRRWLAEHSVPSWQRIYVQDTYNGTPGAPLGMSHIMSLTRLTTGAPQMGTYYGIHPFATGEWTLSEFGRLFGIGTKQWRRLPSLIRQSAVGLIVLSQKEWIPALEALEGIHQVFGAGRFTAWIVDAPAPYVQGPPDAVTIDAIHLEDGRLSFVADVRQAPAGIRTALAYHPLWRLEGAEHVRLEPNDAGLLELRGLEKGRHRMTLEWHPPRWPWMGGLAGLCLFIVIGLRRTFIHTVKQSNHK